MTAVLSAALCALSWQMCSGMDKTRPNLERWSESSWSGQRTVPLPSPYCRSTVPHDYPSTTNNLILKALKQPRPDWTWAFLLPVSHHSLGSDRGRFHRADWEATPSAVKLLPSSTTERFIYSLSAAHKQQANGKQAMRQESTEENQTHKTTTLATAGLVSYLILSTRMHCHLIGGDLLEMSHRVETHYISQPHHCILMSMFLWFVILSF